MSAGDKDIIDYVDHRKIQVSRIIFHPPQGFVLIGLSIGLLL